MQMDPAMLSIALVLTMGVFILAFMASGIKILKEYERVVVLRLGIFRGVKGPGIIWVSPIIEKIAMKVSLREQETKIDSGGFNSSGSSSDMWKGSINWRIVDVKKAFLSVENHRSSVDDTIKANVQEIGESLSNNAFAVDKETVDSRIKETLEPLMTERGVKITEIHLKATSAWDE